MVEPRKTLSPRQAECLRRVRDLQSTDEIARDLNISTGTINGYIKDAITILGARDRRHAALIFAEMEQGRPAVDRQMVPAHQAMAPSTSRPSIDRPTVVNDSGVYADAGDHGDAMWRLRTIIGEILSGSRPDGWSLMTRAVLILASVVIAGFSILAMSAALGVIHSLAVAIRTANG